MSLRKGALECGNFLQVLIPHAHQLRSVEAGAVLADIEAADDLVRSPGGGYSEAHLPVPHDEQFVLTQHLQHTPLEVTSQTDAAGVRRKGGVTKLRARLSRWHLGHDIPKPTAGELTAAAHHGAHGSHGHEHSLNGDGVDGVDGHELDGPRHGSEVGVGAGADKAGLHH